jgi:hypothetical protein
VTGSSPFSRVIQGKDGGAHEFVLFWFGLDCGLVAQGGDDDDDDKKDLIGRSSRTRTPLQQERRTEGEESG